MTPIGLQSAASREPPSLRIASRSPCTNHIKLGAQPIHSQTVAHLVFPSPFQLFSIVHTLGNENSDAIDRGLLMELGVPRLTKLAAPVDGAISTPLSHVLSTKAGPVV